MMPTSSCDPLASALSGTFNKGGQKRLITDKMESNLQKSLLVPVQFDDPVRHVPSAIKSNYIMLTTPKEEKPSLNGSLNNSSSSSGGGTTKPTIKQTNATSLDQVPAAKVTLFRREQIQLGHLKMGVPGAGMWNMGNTCYLNSTLQALFHIPAFANYLRDGGHDSECSLSGFSSCTICILAGTLRQTQQSNVIKPIKIYEKLKFICKHLVHGRQEDAHEFLRYLIESLQRCYLISRKVPKTIDAYSRETTPFNQLFGGYMRQELHCLRCHHVSITFQHFMDLLLDIRNADNIDAALSGYFKKEILSQEDMYKCEKCKQKVPAYKIYKMERPPLVLCIQLKRFNMMGGKNGRPVTLAKNLDISRFIRWASSNNLNFRYRLVSLITHVGPSPNCGHYTAIGEAPNGTYYRFDDSSVNPTSVQNVQNNSAYVIFYEMTKQSRDQYLQGAGRKQENIIGPQLPKQQPCTTNTSKMNQSPTIQNNKPAVIGVKLPTNRPSPPVMPVKPTVKPVNKQPSPGKSSSQVGLVPYGGEDSSSDEENPPNNSSKNAPVKSENPQVKPDNTPKSFLERSAVVKPLFGAAKSPFLPRAVAAQIKRGKETEQSQQQQQPSQATKDLSIYEEKDLNNGASGSGKGRQSPDAASGSGKSRLSPDAAPEDRSVSSLAERRDSGDISSSQERVGFTVADKDSYNPSIHSDNSTGSTHSFTVTELRGSPATSSTSGQKSTPRNSSWNVTNVSKRERSEPPEEHSQSQGDGEALSSPLKRAKVVPEKPKKSVLDDMKNKTTETLREFGKDFLSAGVKFKHQLGIRSNKVTDKVSDKIMKLGKNLEDSMSRAEESSTSCPPSTSQGSSKTVDSDWEDDSDSEEKAKKKHKKKKKKKKKKKNKEKSRANSDSEGKEESDTDEEWEEKKSSVTKESPSENRGPRSPQRESDVPVKKWDSKPDLKQIGRSVTWDGSKGSNFLDEIKKSSTIRSWSGERSTYDQVQEARKRSADSDEEMDRGRTKKVKKRREERPLGYNPFQVVQNIKDRGGPSYARGKYDRDRYSSGNRSESRHRDHRDKYSRDRDYNRDRHRHKEGGRHHDRRNWDHNYHRESHHGSGDRRNHW